MTYNQRVIQFDEYQNRSYHSPYLQHWNTLALEKTYTLYDRLVFGWKRYLVAFIWGIASCLLCDFFLEEKYPALFPIQTSAFTMFSFIIAVPLGLFVSTSTTRVFETIQTYKLCNTSLILLLNKFIDGLYLTTRFPLYVGTVTQGDSSDKISQSKIQSIKSKLINIHELLAALVFVLKYDLKLPVDVSAVNFYMQKNIGTKYSPELCQLQDNNNRKNVTNGIVNPVQILLLPINDRLKKKLLEKNERITFIDLINWILKTMLSVISHTPEFPIYLNAQLSSITTALAIQYATLNYYKTVRVPQLIRLILIIGCMAFLAIIPFELWFYSRWITLFIYAIFSFIFIALLNYTTIATNPYGKFGLLDEMYNITEMTNTYHAGIWLAGKKLYTKINKLF